MQILRYLWIVFPLVACDSAGWPIGELPEASGSGGQAGSVGNGGSEATAPGGHGGAAEDSPQENWSSPRLLLTPPEGTEDQDPFLSSDGLSLYFSSTRPAASSPPNIWTTTRESLADDWGEPIPAAGINSDMRDVNPVVSKDELRMWLSRSDGGAYQLFEAVRASRNDAWTAPVLMQGLGGEPRGLSPSMSENELVLYFNRSDVDLDVDIYRATRESTSELFGVPEPLDGLNSEEADWDVHSHDDMFFILTRGGRLLTVERESVDAPFGEFSEILALENDWAAYDPWVSVDRDRVIYAADDGVSPSRLYEMVRRE